MGTVKRIERSALVNFSAEKMYNLVNDIESYPEYMPGCAGAKILERGDGWLQARLDISKGGFTQSFTTRNELKTDESMSMQLVDGPFSTFEGKWLFEALEENACKVTFKLEFQFANRLLGLAASKTIENVAGEQVDAVCRRAKSLLT